MSNEFKKKQIKEIATIIARNVYDIDEPDIDYLPSARKASKELLDVGYRKQEWISVDDALPQNDERVLVTIDAEGSYTTIDTDRRLGDRWVRWGGSVTHWMPLPEPPKMKGDK